MNYFKKMDTNKTIRDSIKSQIRKKNIFSYDDNTDSVSYKGYKITWYLNKCYTGDIIDFCCSSIKLNMISFNLSTFNKNEKVILTKLNILKRRIDEEIEIELVNKKIQKEIKIKILSWLKKNYKGVEDFGKIVINPSIVLNKDYRKNKYYISVNEYHTRINFKVDDILNDISITSYYPNKWNSHKTKKISINCIKQFPKKDVTNRIRFAKLKTLFSNE